MGAGDTVLPTDTDPSISSSSSASSWHLLGRPFEAVVLQKNASASAGAAGGLGALGASGAGGGAAVGGIGSLLGTGAGVGPGGAGSMFQAGAGLEAALDPMRAPYNTVGYKT